MWVSGYRYLFCFFLVTVHGSTNGLGVGETWGGWWFGSQGWYPPVTLLKSWGDYQESKGIPGPQPPSQSIGWFGRKVDKRLLRDWTFQSVGHWFWKQHTLYLKILFSSMLLSDQNCCISQLSIVNFRRFCHFYNFQKRQETELVDTSIHFWWMENKYLCRGAGGYECGWSGLRVSGELRYHGRSWEVTWFPYFIAPYFSTTGMFEIVQFVKI